MSLAVPGVEALQEVGRGGGGIVYRAWQPDFGRWVAVKVFPADEDVRRLERERLAIGRLSDHPGIVPVLGGGITADGRPYLVMSFMDGGSLADRVSSAGVLSADELVGFGTAMASALQVAHDNGVLHRDIKPANILYDRFGTPRLADFGIAHVGDNAFRTEAGMLSGTIAYMAPELIDGRPFTAAADVFSLGATLFYALQGRHLFEPRPQEMYAAFLVRRVTQAHAPSFSPDVPAALRDVVLAATEPDPARRLPTAAALGAALARASGSGPTALAPLPPPPAQTTGFATGLPPGLPPPPEQITQAYLPPPPPSGPAPAVWGTPSPPQPWTGPSTPSWTRSARARPLTVGAASLAVIAVAGTLWLVAPKGRATGLGPVTSSAPTSVRTGDPSTPSPGSSSGLPSAAGSSPGGPSGAGTASAAPSGADPAATGAPSVQQAVAAFRAAAGGGDPPALEMIFYPFPDAGTGAYAVATLPERAHLALADQYTWRDGSVGPAEPVAASSDLAPAKRWRFGEVNWSSMRSMLQGADTVCRGAMTKAGLPDQADDFGRKAGVTHVIVERDTVFNDGKVVVRVYFGGGARWPGGYVLYAASGKLITTRYCAVD